MSGYTLTYKLQCVRKLRLFEQEDAFGEVGSEETDALAERFCDFKLPDDEFGDLMFDRRLDHHKASSPAMLSATIGDRASTVDDTEGSPDFRLSSQQELTSRRPTLISRNIVEGWKKLTAWTGYKTGARPIEATDRIDAERKREAVAGTQRGGRGRGRRRRGR